jgi:short-subunit dehydrogenase
VIAEMSGLTCIITGSSGSIGSDLSRRFSENGFNVLGIDCVPPNHPYCAHTFLYDINDIVSQPSVKQDFFSDIWNCSFISGLSLIVNCAAFQPLATYEITDVSLYQKALNINAVFPLLLYRLLFDTLCSNNGVLINIGSIHATLTKKDFILYASSKSALRGLTHCYERDLMMILRSLTN